MQSIRFGMSPAVVQFSAVRFGNVPTIEMIQASPTDPSQKEIRVANKTYIFEKRAAITLTDGNIVLAQNSRGELLHFLLRGRNSYNKNAIEYTEPRKLNFNAEGGYTNSGFGRYEEDGKEYKLTVGRDATVYALKPLR